MVMSSTGYVALIASVLGLLVLVLLILRLTSLLP
jgi:hypothetical protein